MDREFQAACSKGRTNYGAERGCVRRVVTFAPTIGFTIRWASAHHTQISSCNAAHRNAYAFYVGARPYRAADIYCGPRLKVDSEHPDKRPAEWLSREHAYPTDGMADVFGCGNRTGCRRDPDSNSRPRLNHDDGLTDRGVIRTTV